MQEGQNNGQVFKDAGLSLKDTSISISYTKPNKLLTATYMVTDILDVSEPIRHKLRLLSLEVISDTYSLNTENFANMSVKVMKNISLILSLLDVGSVLNMISHMNYSILKKEYEELYNSVKNAGLSENSWGGAKTLSEFFLETSVLDKDFHKGHRDSSIGHLKTVVPVARIGVQKGSTLLKALSDKVQTKNHTKEDFDFIKKERRFEIIESIKNFTSKTPNMNIGATIKDISDNAKGSLKATSEKTLQRELVAMVADGVLYKTGSKRWSKYFIKK